MTIYVFKLPDIGEGTAEAEVVAWHVQVGDFVEEDGPLADVMTDKATVEITAPVSGKVISIHHGVGEMAQVGSPLVEFETTAEGAGQAVEPTAQSVPADTGENKAPDIAVAPSTTKPSDTSPSDISDRAPRPKASPAVRRRAKELGISLEAVTGSGPQGRIRQPDLDMYLAYSANGPAFASASPPTSPLPPVLPIADSDFQETKMVGLRRKIAEKMELSTRRIPHFAYVEEVDVTDLELARTRLNNRYGDDRPRLSFLPFFVRALCTILPRYPQINSHYDEASGTIRQYLPVHVGIATQTDGGLMVPVIKNAHTMGLWEIASEISRIAQAARSGTAKRDEVTGSTITITSLGALGGIVTTPVINHPEVAILGPNSIVERPMARNGNVELRRMMNVSSSFDHRVVDGHDAARFIQDLRKLLEDPILLLAF